MDYYSKYPKELNIEGEIWKDIEGYNGKYQVSNFGRIKSIIPWNGTNERILFQQNLHGYYRVGLYLNKKNKHSSVHRLVGQAFIPNADNLPYINHKNGHTLENFVENLEWVTPQQNIQHAFRTGLYDLEKRKGERNPQSKLTEEKVREIRQVYDGKENNYKNLGKKYDVSSVLIRYVVKNMYWKHVV